MYDEFERAVTGKPKKGLSVLAWFGIVVAVLFVTGAVGVGLALRSAVHRVEAFARDFDVAPSRAAAEVLRGLESHVRLASASPEEGLAYLESLDSGDPTEALLERVAEGVFSSAERADRGSRASRAERTDNRRASAAVETDAQDTGDGVRFDLQGDENGGFLTIDTDEGRVRLDLVRTDDGGFLTIDSDDGQVRFDLQRTEDGGFFSIDSDEGQVRFDLSRDEDGGRLVVRTDEEVLRLGLGRDAEGMPSWVPRADFMPDAPREVYSLTSAEGFLGAVSWESTDSPEEVLATYQQLLEGEGYDLKAAHRIRNRADDGGSLWARDELSQRVVFVVTERDGETTRVLLGYGEGQD